jgi:alpha-D-ribose 1-methylphosphonate 5-triphosphate synthase subunit PhnL
MKGVAKRFTLHHQHGAELSVLHNVDLEVRPGECLVLDGPSGMGKSTLLKLIYANYRATEGRITVAPPGSVPVEVTEASPRELVRLRREASAT